MRDAVPGPDAIHLTPPAEGIPSPSAVARYTGVLERLAVPYAVDQQRTSVAIAVRSSDADAGERV